MTRYDREREGGAPTDPTEHDAQALIELLEVNDPGLLVEIHDLFAKLSEYEAADRAATDEFVIIAVQFERELSEAKADITKDPRTIAGYPYSLVIPETAQTHRDAEARTFATLEAIKTSKQALLKCLLAAEGVNKFGRAALVYSLYISAGEERITGAQDLRAQFENLNEQLVENKVLCYRSGEVVGFYRVAEPGLDIEIEVTDWEPTVLAKTKRTEGGTVNTSGHLAHITQDRWHTNLTVFSSVDSPSSPWREELLIGEDVMQGFAAELAPAQRLCLAVIARQQGVPLESLSLAERCGLNVEQLEALKKNVCYEIVSAMMSEKVTKDMISPHHHSVIRSEIPDNNNPSPFGLNLRSDDFEMMRILAELCDLERSVITNAVEACIVELESSLIENFSADPRTPTARIYAGRLRLAGGVLDKREIGIVSDLPK